MKCLGLWSVAMAVVFAAGAARAADLSLADAIATGKPILEERLRFEAVDQAGFAREAQALTLRTHLGWETGAWNGLTGAVEFEDVARLGPEHYNTTLNGKTGYPTVADPDVAELNRLQIAWTPSKAFSATVGRQRINLDDQRFIGSVNWRQDDQTFDAVRLDGGLGAVRATYAYLGKVNRTVGQSADWTSDSHALTGAWTVSPALKAEGFLYALDFKPVPALSTETAGVRLAGQAPFKPVKIAYAAAYATQTDYGRNPGRYRLPYWMGEVSGAWGAWTAKLNYESLGGDGKRGFSTPLATLHVFQGWADAFTTTPARGIDDLNLSLAVAPPVKLKHLSNLQLFARHHDFAYQAGGGSLGTEWDGSVQASLTARLTALVKIADYRGVAGSPSRRKVWLQFDFNL